MTIENMINKLDDYYKRFEKKKIKKIKPGHVKKIIEKLKKREAALREERGESSKESKRESLKQKILVTKEQAKRAEWLLKKVLSEKE